MAADSISEELLRLVEMMAIEVMDDSEQEPTTEVDESMLASARTDLEIARSKLRKAKLVAAKQASVQDRVAAARRHVAVDTSSGRRKLGAAITNVKPANRFTLAARDAQGVPDDDIPGLIEDALDLGIDLDKGNDPDAG